MELVRFSIVHGGFLNVGGVGLSDIKAIDLFREPPRKASFKYADLVYSFHEA